MAVLLARRRAAVRTMRRDAAVIAARLARVVLDAV